MLWLVGVLLAAMASFISNLGVTLQKLQHVRIAAETDRAKRTEAAASYHTGSLWKIGLGLVIFGSVADFVALSFAPQSLIAPLGSLTLVSNVILSPLLLKESVTASDICATLVIITGSVLAVSFASHEDVTYPIETLLQFFQRTPFVVYAIIVAAFVGLAYSFVRHMEKLEANAAAAAAATGTAPVPDDEYNQWRIVLRFAYPSMSGVIGAQSVLFAKCTCELLIGTINGGQLFLLRWQSYFVIAAMCSTIFLQIKWLNDGLKRFDACYIVPVFTSFWITFSVVSGLIFYKEYTSMDDLQCVMFALGIVVTVVGVCILSQRKMRGTGDVEMGAVGSSSQTSVPIRRSSGSSNAGSHQLVSTSDTALAINELNDSEYDDENEPSSAGSGSNGGYTRPGVHDGPDSDIPSSVRDDAFLTAGGAAGRPYDMKPVRSGSRSGSRGGTGAVVASSAAASGEPLYITTTTTTTTSSTHALQHHTQHEQQHNHSARYTRPAQLQSIAPPPRDRSSPAFNAAPATAAGAPPTVSLPVAATTTGTGAAPAQIPLRDATTAFLSSLVPNRAVAAPQSATEIDTANRLVHHAPLPPLHSLLDHTLSPHRPNAAPSGAAAAALRDAASAVAGSLESELNENDMRVLHALNFDGTWTGPDSGMPPNH